MKNLKFPTAQTILFIIAGLVALLTWMVPAGKYESLTYNKESNTLIRSGQDKSTDLPATQKTLDDLKIKIPIENFTNGGIYKAIGIPNTYQTMESRPQGMAAFVQSPIKGIIAAADIIFLVLIIGGLIGIMNLSGAFDAGIASLAKVLKGREYLLIILVTSLIALGGTTFGLAEEREEIRVDLPALGKPIIPTSAISLSSSRSCLVSPSKPGSACSGARLRLLRKCLLPKPPLPPAATTKVSPSVVRSPTYSPVEPSVISVPQGT